MQHVISNLEILSGYLQSKFGVYSIRIENGGVRRPPSDDVQIQGIANPLAFRKVFFNLILFFPRGILLH